MRLGGRKKTGTRHDDDQDDENDDDDDVQEVNRSRSHSFGLIKLGFTRNEHISDATLIGSHDSTLFTHGSHIDRRGLPETNMGLTVV